MANATQTITPTGVAQPFSGRPPQLDENNIYPRARILFKNQTTITAKDALDTKTVTLVHNLPQNYYYTIETFQVQIGLATSLDADNYDLQALQTANFNTAGANDWQQALQGVLAFQNVAGVWACFRNLLPDFGEVMPSLPCEINTFFNDLDAVNLSSALTCVSYVSFLQYDVMQSDMVRVNAPMPVTSR